MPASCLAVSVSGWALRLKGTRTPAHCGPWTMPQRPENTMATDSSTDTHQSDEGEFVNIGDEILNDKEYGEELLRKARLLMSNKDKQINLISWNNSEDCDDATPMIIMATEGEKMGVISQVNLTAASMFGYSKTELINRKVNVLMP